MQPIYSHSSLINKVSSGLLNAALIVCMLAGVTIPSPITTTSSADVSATSSSLMMKREEGSSKAVFGKLYVNGKFVCYTLENREKMIPAGSYIITRTAKGFRLNNVPGRTKINIEIGNYPFESLGCIFVGTGRTDTGVTGSKIALLRLIRLVTLPAQISVS